MDETFRVPGRRRLGHVRPMTAPWQDYAEAWLDFPLGRVLDYGCGDGSLLRRIAERCDACWGVDADPDALPPDGSIPRTQLRAVTPGAPLPFPDASFDVVLLTEVIEHVADERWLLRDLSRVLAPGGRLLLTTPHRGLLTFLDPGNFKFLLPGIHRFIHRRVLRRGSYYGQRFGEERKAVRGMLADFTLDQSAWHRHYSIQQIRALAGDELRTVAWAAYYPAFRALWSLGLALRVVSCGLVRGLPPPLKSICKRLSAQRTTLGDQLVVLFEKCAPAGR